jgi:prevent-host-death family protein
MRMITATEANRDFSKLLERVIAGEEISVTKHGDIVATITPAKHGNKQREAQKLKFVERLRNRELFAPVASRGTRQELYED